MMKKVSFPLPSRTSSISDKPQPTKNFIHDEDEQQEIPQTTNNTEFITEFNPSETPIHQPTLVIPPLPNTWQPHNTLASNFESLSTSPTPTTTTTSYGLNIRPKKENGVNGSSDTGSSIDLKLLQKLREDISKLPEHRGLEEFAEVPVAGFGKAVLTGYGWCEGKGIGKNHAKQEDVKVVQYQGRTGRQGLGFVPKTE